MKNIFYNKKIYALYLFFCIIHPILFSLILYYLNFINISFFIFSGSLSVVFLIGILMAYYFEKQRKLKSLNNLNDKEIEYQFYRNKHYILIYSSSNIEVCIPKTYKAFNFFEKNTKLCTTSKNLRNIFNYYNDKGSLHIVKIKKNNKRYLFHFETNQFINELNEKINLFELFNEYQELYKVHWFTDPLYIYNYNKSK